MIPEDQIFRMAADAQAAIPGLGHRVARAVNLVKSVVYLGDQSGVDWWQVDEIHRVSLKTRTCSCSDHTAPTQDNKGRTIGPVCAHRLAVMFVAKVRKANEARMSTIFAQLSGLTGGRLRVEVVYTGKGTADQWYLKGYFVPGQTWVDFGNFPEDWLEFGPPELVDALTSAGLRIVQKQRSQGRSYIWYLEPAKDDTKTEIRIGVLGSMDADYVEARKREEYLLNKFKAEVKANVRLAV